MKKFLFSIILLCSTLMVCGKVVDHDVMYKAYLDNNMAKWGTELKKYTATPGLTINDKLEISNYLYGYVATLVENAEKNKQEIEMWIVLWEDYLNEIEAAKGKRADVYVYRSAINAYKAKIKAAGMVIYGPRSLADLNTALEIDANNPLAVGLKGNVKFYAPHLAGGDKKESIAWFERALSIISKDTRPVYRWNRCAITLCLAQAYEKTGNKAKAIEICKKELDREPGFEYMRDVYYPSLTKK